MIRSPHTDSDFFRPRNPPPPVAPQNVESCCIWDSVQSVEQPWSFLWIAPVAADELQLQATLAKYFLQVHHAIPLFNNPSVRSGDVLHMPDEDTFLAREKCFQLPPVQYRDLGIEFIETSPAVAAEAGGTIPVDKIGQIEASAGGKLVQNASILLDPFNGDGVPGGRAVQRSLLNVMENIDLRPPRAVAKRS